MNNVIKEEELTAGMSRKQRRAFMRGLTSNRNSKGQRAVDKQQGGLAINHFLKLRDTSILTAEKQQAQELHMIMVLERISTGRGDADDLASCHQFAVILGFLVLSLEVANKNKEDRELLNRLADAFTAAEFCGRASAQMSERHRKTGKVGWAAEERARVQTAVDWLVSFLPVAPVGMWRDCQAKAIGAIESPDYIQNQVDYLKECKQ